MYFNGNKLIGVEHIDWPGMKIIFHFQQSNFPRYLLQSRTIAKLNKSPLAFLIEFDH
jgi:hypothetical protein